MNKTLIAMAVAGVMAAPMAAQADATVYGKIHVSIDSGDTGGQDLAPDNASGLFWQSNSGRVGVKGSEDLGGGLTAVWQFESNASFGSGSTSFGGRNSYLGLKGGWGEFRGGKHDTPFKGTGRKFDLFGDQVGDHRNLTQRLGSSLSAVGGESWDNRPDNVVAYMTPTFGGGFKVFAAYVMDDATEDSTGLSIEGSWKSGNWLAALAYETHDQDSTAGPGTTSSSDGIRAGLQWSPGAWKLNAFYQTIADSDGLQGFDGDAYGLGAAYKMGKNVFKLQGFATSNDFGGVTTDVDSTLMAVGWDYNMSKRTTAYIAYATTSNDANVYYCADAGGHGGEICGQALDTNTGPGDDPSVISFGMVHKF
jgi:predicted porin